jgi:hypothetical protein
MTASTMKHKTLPRLVSSISRNTVATTKLVVQLVVVDKLLAVPITCKGYISAFTVHGVEDIPVLKLAKKMIIPEKAT